MFTYECDKGFGIKKSFYLANIPRFIVFKKVSKLHI